jgi:CDP-4-dehydro-6-deoxyglucose reductase, E1
MNKYKITYGGALIGKAEKKAILKFVDKNWWPLAGEGEKMEKEAAKFLGVKYGILANSGSSAGLLALCALELPPGSEVIIPATTFPTIFNIILQCGLVPVVVDSKIGSYNLDPKELKKAITKKTKAIICVHAVGNPVDMPAVMKVAKKHKLYVLEDNCDGWGGMVNGKKVGSFGHISFTSFHAAHIVAMGQGGGVFTNDKRLAKNARMYRDWGRQANLGSRTNHKWPTLPKDYDSRFIYEKIGYNLSPLELQAAMGREQLKKTKQIKALRKRNFHYLYKKLSQFGDLIMPHWVKGADPSWFAFPLSCCSERGPLVAFLEKHGIETRSMFAGNILKHPAYTHLKVKSFAYEANFILEQSFWISVHPRYSTKDLDYVVQVFKKYYASLA